MALLESDDLHVHYGNIQGVRGISLSVAEGEIVALLGSRHRRLPGRQVRMS